MVDLQNLLAVGTESREQYTPRQQHRPKLLQQTCRTVTVAAASIVARTRARVKINSEWNESPGESDISYSRSPFLMPLYEKQQLGSLASAARSRSHSCRALGPSR